MLSELSIRDLVLIEAAELELAPGLNTLTGETGAGKSLFVGALELLRGETPRGARRGEGMASLVRPPSGEARVEGRFLLRDRELVERVAACLRAELPALAPDFEQRAAQATERAEPVELILGRSISRDGRTRAHVDQRPVPLRALARLAGLVLEIHGQNDHQRLLDPKEQTRLFDAFAGARELALEYGRARERWLELAGALAKIDAAEAERSRQLDFLRFERDELRAAKCVSGEHPALLEERELLRGAEELRFQLGGLVHGILAAEDALLDRVKSAGKLLERWSERLPRLAPALEALRGAEVELEDAGSTLGTFLEGIADDPARLELVEVRLSELERLAKKYRVSEEELPAALARIEGELDLLEGGPESRAQLERSSAAARDELERLAAALSRARAGAAEQLASSIRASLTGLGLQGARFEVALRAREDSAPDGRFGPHGAEDVEFLLAANPGEECRSLGAVASFGEAARIMLALRTVLSAGDRERTLVFDEIDSGVGGRLGPEVGNALRALAEQHQVLCVTHLPAIAALAQRHFGTVKEVRGTRTRTTIAALAGEARVSEVADMIAGGAGEETARAEARRLLGETGAAATPPGAGRRRPKSPA